MIHLSKGATSLRPTAVFFLRHNYSQRKANIESTRVALRACRQRVACGLRCGASHTVDWVQWIINAWGSKYLGQAGVHWRWRKR